MIGRSGNDGGKLRTCTVVIVGLVVGLLIGTCRMSVPAAADPIAIKVQGPDTIGNPLPIQAQPPGATGSTQTAITASSAGAAAAQTATLAAVAAKTTYISGVVFSSGGATAGSVITCTVTGTITGTLSFSYTIPTGVAVSNPPMVITFNPPVPASAVNTTIVCSIPSATAGNTGESVAAWGFQQ